MINGRDFSPVKFQTDRDDMKRWMCLICLFALLFSLSACGAEHDSDNLSSEDVVTQNTQTDVANKDAESEMQPDSAGEQGENGMNDFVMKIGDREIAVSWEDNESVSALMDLAKVSPLQIELSMYGGFEQVGAIGSSLPKNDVQLVTRAGDIVLYSGNQIVVFYGSNSWSYTRLGRVEGMTQQELTELLGNGDVVLSLFFRDSNGEKTDAYPIEDITLNSGYTMPVIGLGTWTLSNEEAENSVYHALKSGMRLIDTARYYHCEVGVGRGIQRAINEGIVSRDEIFVTSKVMPSDYDRAAQGIDDSLSDLNLSYVDLMLIHQPGSNDEEVYKAMEQAVRDGKVREDTSPGNPEMAGAGGLYCNSRFKQSGSHRGEL